MERGVIKVYNTQDVMSMPEKLTFDEVAEEWLNSLKGELRETSIARYRFLLETKVCFFRNNAQKVV